MILPKVGEYGKYRLEGGSIIYPSGNNFEREGTPIKAPNPGKFLLWICNGFETAADGHEIPKGDFVMDKSGLVYYNTPQLALEYINDPSTR